MMATKKKTTSESKTKSRPKPEKERFGGPRDRWERTIEDLRKAVDEFCAESYLWRWREPLTLGVRSVLQIFPELRQDAYALAIQQRERARRHFGGIEQTARELMNLRDQNLVSEDAAEAARVILQMASAALADVQIRPSRHDWLQTHVELSWPLDQLDVEDLAVMSLVGGWWPADVTPQYVAEKGSSVANVVGREKKAMRSALRHRRDLQDATVKNPYLRRLLVALEQIPKA